MTSLVGVGEFSERGRAGDDMITGCIEGVIVKYER
jgi:hypothetical protein